MEIQKKDSVIREKEEQLAEARKVVGQAMASSEQQLKAFSIPFADIEFQDKLGEGSFGTVYKGVLRGATAVAIKTMRVSKVTIEAVEKFQAELVASVPEKAKDGS